MKSLRHLGAFYRDDDGFLSASLAFLAEAMAADEPVLVVVGPRHQRLVQENLAAVAPTGTRSRLVFRNAEGVAGRPAQAMAGYRAMITDHPGQRVRILAEPSRQVDRHAGPRREWIRFEAAVNALLADSPTTMLCLADERYAAETGQGMTWTHPEFVDASGINPNLDYRAAHLVEAYCDRQLARPVPGHAATLRLADADLAPLRAAALRTADEAGLAPEDRARLLTVVTEVATNALLHGQAPATCALWADGEAVTCQVQDRGRWHDAAFIGLDPPRSPHLPGFGLWAVRALCPQLQFHADATGTIVRITLEPSASPPRS